MSLAALPNIDPYFDNEANEAHVDKLWLSNLVDTINSTLIIIQNLSAIASQINIGGSGAGPINVTVTGLTTASIVTASLISSSNPVSILTIVPAANKFSITFSADPGASAIIAYIAFVAPQ